VLLELECDGCGATIKPHPDIARSGWIKTGVYNGPGTEKFEWDYCPDCAVGKAEMEGRL